MSSRFSDDRGRSTRPRSSKPTSEAPTNLPPPTGPFLAIMPNSSYPSYSASKRGGGWTTQGVPTASSSAGADRCSPRLPPSIFEVWLQDIEGSPPKMNMMTGFFASKGGKPPPSHSRKAIEFTQGLVPLVTKGTARPDSRHELNVKSFLDDMSRHPWARVIEEPQGGVAAEKGLKVWIQVEEPET